MKLRLRRGRRPEGGGLFLRSGSGLEAPGSTDLRQEGHPCSWVEAQHGPFRSRAVAYADAATGETGRLDALPIAHAVGTLLPTATGIKFIGIVPDWGLIVHL